MKTLVSFILDETGSMLSCEKATISGFNEYVESLKNGKGDNQILFTLTKFNSGKISTDDIVDIDKVGKLTNENYKPENLTPLYDAIGKTINKIKTEENDIDKYLVVILTDGEENASQEYDQKDIFAMIKKLEEKGNWSFAYLGANQDSWFNASKIGLSKGNTMNFDTENIKATMSKAGGASLHHLRSSNSSTKTFFK